MTTRALVLGGGGPVGIAWETGLIAGLGEGGVAVHQADWILGTSAGSFVGANLALRRDPAAMFESELAYASLLKETGGPPRPAPDLSALMGLLMRKPPNEHAPVALRIELGRLALESKTVSEEVFIAGFGPLAESQHPWPAGYGCTAVDAETGDFVVWSDQTAAPLARAVASSCSVPGIFPPITIEGRRYIDGGMRSGTNADVAHEHDRVLIIAVVPPAFAPFMLGGIEAERARLHDAGRDTALIIPDAASGEVFGPNLMDGSRRADIARAGYAQGKAEAERVGAFWG
ncbi:MAG: patatin-like phospholipase family protein [Caulobacter sp.]|nr:patatin-like phospholipase family protein [Caulobacter sp.]